MVILANKSVMDPKLSVKILAKGEYELQGESHWWCVGVFLSPYKL